MHEAETLLRSLAEQGLDASANAPIWIQIADRLTAACADGRLEGGIRLPGENRMSEIFGVTRVTLRRALRRLQLEGLVHSRKGVGTFVRPGPLQYRLDHNRQFIDGVDLPLARVRSQTLTLTRGRAAPDEAGALDLSAGDEVIRLGRLRLLEEGPIYLTAKTFPANVFPGFEEAYAPAQSVQDVYRAHGMPGYRRLQTRISGGFATPEEAAALRLSPRMPVLRTVGLNENENGQKIEHSLGTWPLTAVEFLLPGPVRRGPVYNLC